ncbi:MAG: hypothetical protein KF868_11080 [Acidobacteria bacterium]|nr:hypothetical protein [Acidobacteriota bacterium]
MKISLALLTLILLTHSAFAQSGDIYVAIRQAPLQTNTKFLKLPVEVQRGERWEVVKQDKKKVILTFGPQDERRGPFTTRGMKPPTYEISATEFTVAFVPESAWPAKRRELAAEIQKKFADLSPEQCERVVDGEYWVGMKTEHAAQIAGNRILGKEASETADGKTEIWKVGFFSAETHMRSAAKVHLVEGELATPSRPRGSTDAAINQAVERGTRFVLRFKNGELAEITQPRV